MSFRDQTCIAVEFNIIYGLTWFKRSMELPKSSTKAHRRGYSILPSNNNDFEILSDYKNDPIVVVCKMDEGE